MTLARLASVLLLALITSTSAFARGGMGHGGGMGMAHAGVPAGGASLLTTPMLPAPSIDNSTSALTGPSGPPGSSLSTPFGSRLNPGAGTLYPNQMNSLSSIGAGQTTTFGAPAATTTPPDVTPVIPSTAVPSSLGTPQIMVPER